MLIQQHRGDDIQYDIYIFMLLSEFTVCFPLHALYFFFPHALFVKNKVKIKVGTFQYFQSSFKLSSLVPTRILLFTAWLSEEYIVNKITVCLSKEFPIHSFQIFGNNHVALWSRISVYGRWNWQVRERHKETNHSLRRHTFCPHSSVLLWFGQLAAP